MQTNPVTQEIRDAHHRITGLLQQLEAVDARTPEMREPAYRQLRMETEILGRLEEENLFPVLLAVESDEAGELHGVVALARDGLSKSRSALENFMGAESSLQRSELLGRASGELELFLRHQEEELLPRIDRELQSRLFELGTWFKSRREELLRLPEYADAQPQVTQNPNGGEQMRKPAASPGKTSAA